MTNAPSDYDEIGKKNLECLSAAVKYIQFIQNTLTGFIGTSKKPVLDFGAGTGEFALFLKNQGHETHCVELDDEFRQHLEKSGLKSFKHISDLPNSFERIYTTDVIEHIEDDEAILQQLADALEPGGKILIYVPAFMALYSNMDKQIGHFRRYRKKELKNKLTATGLHIESAHYVDCIGFFGSLFFKYFGASDGSIDSPAVIWYYKHIFPISRTFDAIFKPFFGKNLLVIACKN